MKRVALYVRVSTQEQKNHGLSVDSQIQALKDYALENNLEIAGIYNDAGISARKKYTKRPALLKLIKDCEDRKIDMILFTKLDRWFRSVADYYDVQTQLDAFHVPWRAIWEDYETETSAGCFKVNIMLSVAQAEADRTSERIKSVFEYQRSQGKYVGDVPFGYIKKNGQVLKDPETSKAVEIAFEKYLETHSTTASMKALIEAGFNISRSGLSRVLTGSAYYGDCNGFACEPYITREEHDRIMDLRKGNSSARHRKNFYKFQGICICAQCGNRMRAVTNTQDGKDYRGYFCTGIDGARKHEIGAYISEIKLEKYLLKNLEEEIGAYNVTVETRSKDLDQDEIDQKRKSLDAKLERIGIRFEEGDITTEEYKEKRKAIQSEIASLNSLIPSEKLELPEGWRAVYDDLDEEHARSFWYSIIKEIRIYPKMNPTPDIVFLS